MKIFLFDVAQIDDGGFWVLASTKESINSERYCWLFKINNDGIIEWNETIPSV